MARSKPKVLPPSKSVSELAEFFETHDMGEYWDQMPEAHFEVRIERKRHLVAIEEELSARLTEIAKAKKVSSEALVNTWLKERIRKAS